MELTVNGKTRQLRGRRTVHELVVDLGLGKAAIAVELNQQVIPRADHKTAELNDGDQIEIVTLVGGG